MCEGVGAQQSADTLVNLIFSAEAVAVDTNWIFSIRFNFLCQICQGHWMRIIIALTWELRQNVFLYNFSSTFLL